LISFSLSEEKPRYNEEYKMYRIYIGKARENYLGHRIGHKTEFLLRIGPLWKWVKLIIAAFYPKVMVASDFSV
jgi:hypothetical protein